MKRLNVFLHKKLSGLTGGKIDINPVMAKEDAKYPFINYTCESFEAVRTKDRLEGFLSYYAIDIYTKMFDDGDALADDIIKLLDGYRDADLIEQCRVESGGVTYGNVYITSLKFKIAHGW